MTSPISTFGNVDICRALSSAECDTVNALFLEGRLVCEELLVSFFDTRNGTFLKRGQWLKLEQVLSASDRTPSPQEKAGTWTLLHKDQRTHDAKDIVRILRDELGLVSNKPNGVSPLAYLPASVCGYVNVRYATPYWWVDCAIIPDKEQVGTPFVYTAITPAHSNMDDSPHSPAQVALALYDKPLLLTRDTAHDMCQRDSCLRRYFEM